MKYMSKKPLLDREIYKKGGTPSKIGAEESNILIFRNMMIEKRDLEIADILWNYFDAVRQHWPDYWNNLGRGQMLSKSNGFRGLMKFLRDAYLFVAEKPGHVPKTTDFLEKVFNRIGTPEGGFDVRMFTAGTSGETALYRFLMEKSGIPKS
jgi:hypothetical protein